MINSKYLHQNRGHKKTAILLPGWATDFRIFKYLDLPYNYILVNSIITEIPTEIEQLLLSKKEKVALVGFSMGGYIALDMAAKYPDKIEKVLIYSIRPYYPAKDINLVKKYLIKNKNTYLTQFYKSCFFQESDFDLFKKELLSDYLEKFETKELLELLAWLGEMKINEKTLTKIKNITFIHGKKDLIAPFVEIETLATRFKDIKINGLENRGHIGFYVK